ncbi:GSCFA domain-containing protein [Tannerella sp.]|uniref:GSCFA domain-containing protein n=1 Tax=Tannerella sp. TaxID=2382127 RepID=UPI0026DBEED9|nr:GSCFA domain-containing protein [Tannerella sp.]MDO4703968.1 GSCFA domain-containing protein [Tannerella sp.]
MILYTKIDLPRSPIHFTYEHRIMMFGSCFAESIGSRLSEALFRTDINPFGTLYNPASVAMTIERLLDKTVFICDELFQYEGLYHSFFHHSSFSSLSADECLRQINERLRQSAAMLSSADRIVVTFGTAYVYRLKETSNVVANCHKLPEKHFERTRLSVEEIVSLWEPLIAKLQKEHPSLQWLFTVSPIRHWRDGAHENQLSKATLLLAVEALQQRFPEQTAYFPAYELMMDELRDYRFYADDMCHPSPTAIQYIWERFVEVCMDERTRRLLNEAEEIRRALHHRPFNPKSEAYQQFLTQTLLKIERFNEKMPYLCFEQERKDIERLQTDR